MINSYKEKYKSCEKSLFIVYISPYKNCANLIIVLSWFINYNNSNFISGTIKNSRNYEHKLLLFSDVMHLEFHF